MKNILGLDLGTNSIGWALLQTDEKGHYQPKINLGSRIIPMTQDVLSTFEGGKPIETQTAARTQKRGMRRLNERRLLRRERLFRALHILGFLPSHFDQSIGWDRTQGKTFGKFIDLVAEPKIAWVKDNQGKMQFLFKGSFEEMLSDFRQHQPELVADGKKIPYDWTLYYLRQKALSQPISKEELAWILLNFNQKRGYYQLRGKDEMPEEEDKSKRVEYRELVVKSVTFDPTEKVTDKGRWYNVELDNGMIYRRQSKESLDNWIGKKREFIITTELDEKGNEKLDKDGLVKRSFRSPKPEDWTLRKVRTEHGVEQSGLTVGAFIYQHILSDPSGKIIGKYVETIDRKFYKQELYKILTEQSKYHKELTDSTMLDAVSEELYVRNESRQDSLKQKSMTYLLIEDILFYQRPLKSKKSLISECPYEYYKYVDKETGEEKIQHLKCIAKSNPFFQEFRILQFIQNLKIYDATAIGNVNVTDKYLPDTESYAKLYNWLKDQEEVSQDSFLKNYLGLKKPKGKDSSYPLRWNYVEDKKYPMGETRALLLKGLQKAGISADLIAEPAEEYRLWHLLYSIDDFNELQGALRKYAECKHLPSDDFVKAFDKIKPFDKEYGSYSEKAIKKLLPYMRSGVALHDACQKVYQHWSEGLDTKKWTSPVDLHSYICKFQQHSLRNPIVEQCILETLRTVGDIWQRFGHIDEIHLELGREMKNPADKRKRIAEQNQRNENTNLRIKALLLELLNDSKVEGVHPNSPMQQDILRLYEEGALLELRNDDPDYKEILAISQMAQPSASQLTRYKLWLEQRYRSPYTGRVIPLAKLFTPAYQIEHVIPRARYYDDSLNNKVICEAEVNKDKTNLLAHEYICKNEGKVIQTVSGPVKVFLKGEYEEFIRDHYAGNKGKQQRLMLDDVPDEFIQRQLNDSRYISKVIKSLLSNIVREEDEDQDISKNLIVCTGGVTDRLKKDWGMNDVWNHIVYPRYERLNQLTDTNLFGQWETKEGGKRVFQTSMPLALQRGYSKKRIDHRHHAMDALVIACASRNIVNLLSNQNASDRTSREDLKHLLCGKGGLFMKPWDSFTQDAEQALAGIVVSIKNKVRVLARASNRYDHIDANGKKRKLSQQGEKQFAVRKPLHKETVYGHVNLQRTKPVSLDTALNDVRSIVDKDLRNRIIDLFSQGLDKKAIKKKLSEENIGKQIEVRYFTDSDTPMVAVRKKLDESFDQKKILSISDTGIQKILLAYLGAKGGNAKEAFSPEGIAEMNENIESYNGGKKHQPILNVRVTEPMGEKFQIGYSGNKSSKYAIASDGTNLYYAIYIDNNGKRSFKTYSLRQVYENLNTIGCPVPELLEDGNKLLFSLSPNDLVYVPTTDEILSHDMALEDLDLNRIYRCLNTSTTRSYFMPANFSQLLFKVKDGFSGVFGDFKNEVGCNNVNSQSERSLDGIMIKSICWKLEVDRLGQITKIIR